LAWNRKNFSKIQVVFKMSDENARKRAKKNQSDGAYLKGCMARSTCPMQPAWLKLAPTDDTIAIHSETAGQTQQPWFNK
jgi:hypothetical protein